MVPPSLYTLCAKNFASVDNVNGYEQNNTEGDGGSSRTLNNKQARIKANDPLIWKLLLNLK